MYIFKRSLAFFLDWQLLNFIAIVLLRPISAVIDKNSFFQVFLFLIVYALVATLYSLITTYLLKTTVGKRVLRLATRKSSDTTKDLDTPVYFSREFSKWLLLLTFRQIYIVICIILLAMKRETIHDMFHKSTVIDVNPKKNDADETKDEKQHVVKTSTKKKHKSKK